MKKIILDLCGGTGSWSEPYRKAGYDVRLITLPDGDVKSWGIAPFPNGKHDLLFSPPGDKSRTTEVIPIDQIHGILAAPPCTMFSVARSNKSKVPRDFVSAMDTVQACLEIIWSVRANGYLKWWALENPVGYLRQFLGKPHYTFQPWWFGAQHSKRTDLWGYFKTPRRKFFQEPLDITKRYPNGKANGRGWAKPPVPEEYKHLNLTRADLRAITAKEFAQAFFKANP